MNLTCLGLGVGHRNAAGPACHLLEISGAHILLECPLDMSVIEYFLPPLLFSADGLPYEPRNGLLDTSCLSTGRTLNKVGPDVKREKPIDNRCKGTYIKTVGDDLLLEVEPWYKTADLALVDISSLDAVLISNPEGMLGLPYVTRMSEFSGKVYATSIVAKLGQLMMEELVSMHGEFIQNFGTSNSKFPVWLQPATLLTFPKSMRRDLVADDGVGRANWQRLYSKRDIETCMRKVHCLHYDEEISLYDGLRIRPCSSGSELGSSNWIIHGSKCLSYFSASEFITGHAMGLNLSSHASSEVLLFSDLKDCCMSMLGLSAADSAVAQNHYDGSKSRALDHVSKESSSESQKVQEAKVSSLGTSLIGQGQSLENTQTQGKVCLESGNNLPLVCKAALDAVTAGGSVLVTISGIGASLELLEAISQQLRTSNMGHIPMLFISPAAEEILVYTNTLPEWLCAMRQDKLFAGESLFGHVELLQEKHLHCLSAFHSPKCANVWREPCIVFASHWSLRMGPAVCLLHKFRQDSRCLLILTQALPNPDRVLIPFMPIALKVLHYPTAGRLRAGDVAAIIEKLNPELSLLPETIKDELQQVLGKSKELPGQITQYYNTFSVSVIPVSQDVAADMSVDLACQFHPKNLSTSIAMSHMTMSLKWKAGRLLLELPTHSEMHESTLSFSARDGVCWGSVEMIDLVKSLEERGLYCETRAQNMDDTGQQLSRWVTVGSPAFAKVELRSNTTVIETDDPVVRQLIADAVKSLLHVM